MRSFNRIIGFLAVGFVLLFQAKISKADLYTAYFRQITDIEIRNSQALDKSDEAVSITPEIAQSRGTELELSGSALIPEGQALPDPGGLHPDPAAYTLHIPTGAFRSRAHPVRAP